MNVHQLLSGAGPHDAITTEALAFRSYFTRWGWGGRDHAARIIPGSDRSILPLGALHAGPEDILLLHHSARAPRLREVLALPNRKLLLYHNVTPADWLWDQAPLVAVQCAIGREQLPALVRFADVAAADSAFNAAELRALGASRTEVIPLLVDLRRLGSPDGDRQARDRQARQNAPTVLFVGRLSPHKREDAVIKAFSLYRRHHAPEARLVLVGDPLSTGYVEYLRGIANELAPGAVTIESGLSEFELGERYRAADVFLCLSEHEGFCIPLLEAFYFGLPVIARPVGAVPETVGDAGILVDDADLAVVAELVQLVISDDELRRELCERGRERLEAYSAERVAGRLRVAVEAAAAAPGMRSQADIDSSDVDQLP